MYMKTSFDSKLTSVIHTAEILPTSSKMASNALEEKISKIKLKNEEIKRRYEEVEADKKNAAKLNALVQMVPSSDWPERKETPDFIRKESTKSNLKPKIVKEYSGRTKQYSIGSAEGKKTHKFAQGDGPPPDPKYNFLADTEREEHNEDSKRHEELSPKGANKHIRNGPRRRGGGRDGYHKDHRALPSASREGPVPEYDAWRAERNRIDEARISRQRTAEGNWRREWDSDKTNVEKDSFKKDPRFLSNETNRDHKEFDRRHQFDGENSHRGRGGNPRNSYGLKTSQNHYDNQYSDYSNEYSKVSQSVKGPLSPTDDRTVIATDKSIRVTLNQGTTPVKGPVMSVKVNSPSIAGTGRVGPRQKTRVTYSSQSEVDVTTHQTENVSRQKSFDEKVHFNSVQRSTVLKSPYMSRKKENGAKSPYPQRKDTKRDDQSMRPQKHGEYVSKSSYPQKKEFKDTHKSPQSERHSHTATAHAPTSPRARVQNQLYEGKTTYNKTISQVKSSENRGSAIKQFGEITIDKATKIDQVLQGGEYEVSTTSNFETNEIIEDTKFPQEINVQSEKVIKEKELSKEIENTRDTNLKSIDIDSCKKINTEIINHESTVLVKIEENKLQTSTEIPYIKHTKSDSNLKNKNCKTIENDDETSYEDLNKELSNLEKGQHFKIIETTKSVHELSDNRTYNSTDILSPEAEVIIENIIVEKDLFSKIDDGNAKISKDKQNEKLEKTDCEILEKSETLDAENMENNAEDCENVKKSELSESDEILNNDSATKQAIENSSSEVEDPKIDSNEGKTSNSEVIEKVICSDIEVATALGNINLKNDCEDSSEEAKSIDIKSKSALLTAKIDEAD